MRRRRCLVVALIALAVSCGSPSAEVGDATLLSVGLEPGGSVQPGMRVVKALEASEQDLAYEVVSVPDDIEASFVETKCSDGRSGPCFNLKYGVDSDAPDGSVLIGIKVTDAEGRENLLDYEVVIDATPLD